MGSREQGLHAISLCPATVGQPHPLVLGFARRFAGFQLSAECVDPEIVGVARRAYILAPAVFVARCAATLCPLMDKRGLLAHSGNSHAPAETLIEGGRRLRHSSRLAWSGERRAASVGDKTRKGFVSYMRNKDIWEVWCRTGRLCVKGEWTCWCGAGPVLSGLVERAGAIEVLLLLSWQGHGKQSSNM